MRSSHLFQALKPSKLSKTMASIMAKSKASTPMSSLPKHSPIYSKSLHTKLRISQISHFNVSIKQSTNPPLGPTKTVVRAQAIPSPDYMPDSEFYKIEAILRPWRVQQVSAGLLKIGIRGVTVSDVRGFGAQGGSTERQAGSEFSEDMFVAKVKMEIVVKREQVEDVIEKIIEEAKTGEIGDGKIFVMPVSDVIRIRTGERGEQAERMTGGRSDLVTSVN